MASRVKKLTKKEIKERIEKGWLHINVLFEIAGNPKDHVEKALQAFLDNIAQDEHIIELSEELEETIEIEGSNGVFSTAAEVEYLVLGLEKLTWFAFNFMPASIEIKAPAELTFRDKDFSAWINDLLAKLHEVNALHTTVKGEKDALVRNLNAAIRNSILLALNGEMNADDIGKKIGLDGKKVQPFLDAMIKESKLEEKGKKYIKK